MIRFALLFFFCSFSCLQAQNGLKRRAISAYENDFYAEAIKLWKDPKVQSVISEKEKLFIADAYYELKRYIQSFKSLEAVVYEELDIAEQWKYNRIKLTQLIQSGERTAAQILVENLAEDQKAYFEKLLRDFKDDPKSYTLFKLTEEPYLDYNFFAGLSYYNDKLLYSGPVENAESEEELNKTTGMPYYDIYEVDSAFSPSSKKLFSLELTSIFDDGLISFDSSFTHFFMSTNHPERGEIPFNKPSTLSLYEGKIVNGQPTGIIKFPFNSRVYSLSHPALSYRGDTLVYVSNPDSETSKKDLYFSFKTASGEWSTPEKLGDEINTEFDEVFPYLDKSNNLYFSSEGHPGRGGLDIYLSIYENGTWAAPVNLGETINSRFDDFGYVEDPNDNMQGYFSSNLGGQRDRVFKFKKDYVLFFIDLDDDSLNTPTPALLKIFNKEELVAEVPLENVFKDTYNINNHLGHPEHHRFELLMLGAKKIQGDFELGSLARGFEIEPQRVWAQLNVFAADTREKVQYKWTMRNEKGSISEEMGTGKNRIDSVHVQLYFEENISDEFVEIHLESAGFLPQKRRVSIAALDKVIDFALIREVSPENDFTFGDILFDFDSYTIKKEGQEILKVVAEELRQKNQLKIRIIGHADQSGDERYNVELSLKRAMAVANFFLSNGIIIDRISAFGYGEYKPLTVENSEFDRNRRVELVFNEITSLKKR